MQLALQALRHRTHQVSVSAVLADEPHGSADLAGDVRTGGWPRPRVLARPNLASLQARGLQLPGTPGTQHLEQRLGGLGLARRPGVALAEAVLPERPREPRQEPQLHAAALPERRLGLRQLEVLPSRQVLLEDEVLDVLHPSHGHVAHTSGSGNGAAHADARAPQRHALRLPMRQRPSKGKRKLRARDVAVRRGRHRRRVIDRHPALPTGLTEEATLLATRPVQVHLVELNDHGQGRAQLRRRRVRVEARRQHKATNVTGGAVHEAGLHPLVRRQEHTRADAEAQLGLQATEVLGLHARGVRSSRVLVHRANR